MNTAHTATPWNVAANNSKAIETPVGGKESASRFVPHRIANVDTHENAEFIVRAVNAYDKDQETIADLVKALRDALPVLRTEFLQLAEKYAGTAFENDPACKQVQARYDNAKAALAKAGAAA